MSRDRRHYRSGLVLCVAMCLVGCDTSLNTGLDDRQADDMVALLRQEGIPASREKAPDGKWSLKVADRDVRDAERVIHRYELPRDARPRVPDLFPGTGLMPSQLEEHIRYQYAVGQELSATIERIDGVVSASVQVALPMDDKRRTEKPKPSASVFVRYRSDQRVDLMRTQIRNLVAHALPDGVEDEVVVFTLPVAPIIKVHADGIPSFAGGDEVAWASRVFAWLPWLILLLAGMARWHAPSRERFVRAWRHAAMAVTKRRASMRRGRKP